MQCQNETCTAEAHVLYLPYCEDCWNEAHSLLPSSAGHSVAYAHVPRRAKKQSDDDSNLSLTDRGYRR